MCHCTLVVILQFARLHLTRYTIMYYGLVFVASIYCRLVRDLVVPTLMFHASKVFHYTLANMII